MTAIALKGKLTVEVKSAKELNDVTLLSKMDPFVTLKVGNSSEHFKTKIHKDAHKTPVWEQSFIFNLDGKEDALHVVVLHEGTVTNDNIGRLDLNWRDVKWGTNHWYDIVHFDNFKKITGKVLLNVAFNGTGLPSNLAPASATSTPVSAPAKVSTPAAATSPPAPVTYVQQPSAAPQQQQQLFRSTAPSTGIQTTATFVPAPAPTQVASYPGQQPAYGRGVAYPPQQQVYAQQPVYQQPMQVAYQQPMGYPPQQYPGQPVYQQPMYGVPGQPVMYAQQPVVYVQAPPGQYPGAAGRGAPPPYI
jgi:hypothetical protein